MENLLIMKMIEYFSGDIKRINHFLKVYGFAKVISSAEISDEKQRFTINCAAIVHDIGIKLSEIKYGSSAGKLQEKEGPPEAERILSQLNFEKDTKDRICWLIAHHHTYNDIKDIDLQILVEADFLVNIFEDSLNKEAAQSVYRKIFKTETGKKLFRDIYKFLL